MNILVMASMFPRGKDDQAPEFVLDLSRQLAKKHETIILAPHDAGAEFRERLAGIEVRRFPYFLPGWETLAYRGGMVNRFRESWMAKIQLPFFLLAQLAASLILVRRHKIDLVHAHWLFPQGFTAWLVSKILGTKYIVTTHGADVAILSQPKVARLLAPVTAGAKYLTFVSRINRETALRAIPYPELKNKSGILTMGIYGPEKPTNITERKFKLLFIGRLVRIKGVDYLLKAVAESKNRAKIELDILGDGPFRKEWENLAKKLKIEDAVNFRGYVRGKMKDKFLKEANVMIVPSIVEESGFQEGLPVTALEAMAYGKVLIATATGGLPELIEDGADGILIKPNSSKALAEAIDRVVENDQFRINLSRKAVRKSKEYSWERIGNKLEEILINKL